MVILAIDQSSTVSGYAVGSPELGCFACGRIVLPQRFTDIGSRFLMFERKVQDLVTKHSPALVAFEAHRAHSGVQAGQMLGAVSGLVMKVAKQNDISFIGAEVGQHKKVFTGIGRASKQLSLAVARKKYPGLVIEDDNVADAISILHWAFTQV